MGEKKNGRVSFVPRETLLEDIGRQILVRRTQLGLKFNKLEEISGISTVTLSNLEKGKLTNISLGVLEKIADALEMELEVFLSKPKK